MLLSRSLSLSSLGLLLAVLGCQQSVPKSSSDLSVAYAEKVQSSDAITSSVVAIGAKASTAENFSPFCTGVLIRPDVVLTAAHCLDGVTGEVAVGFGTDMKSPKDVREAYGVRHESYDAPYNEPFSFDLALLKIKGPMPVGARWMPRMRSGDLQVGEQLFLAGFGVSSQKKERNSALNEQNTALHKTALQVVRIFDPDLDDDMSEYGLFVAQSADRMAQVCQGDSGAPVYRSSEQGLLLAGIAVGGYGACAGKSYQTNVAFYQEWIDQTIKSLETHEFPKVVEGLELPQLSEDDRFLVSYQSISEEELAARQKNSSASVQLEQDPRKGRVLIGGDPREAESLVSRPSAGEEEVQMRRYRVIHIAHIASGQRFVAYATFLDEDDGGNTLGWLEDAKGRRVANIADSFFYSAK